MKKLFLISIVFLLSSCHLSNCKVIKYNEESKMYDTLYITNYKTYTYNEYFKAVTFQDYWSNNVATYNNVIEIEPIK